MIIRINNGESAGMFNELLEYPHPQAAKIRDIYGQYGLNQEFYRFYGILENDLPAGIALIKYNTAVLYVPSCKDLSEIQTFLGMSEDICALNICGDVGKKIGEYLNKNVLNVICESGKVMKKTSASKKENLMHIEETRDYLRVFSLLKDTFGTVYYNEAGYMTWHCEISHAVRHGHSIVYKLNNDAVIIAQFIKDKIVLLSQLGVSPPVQGKGLGAGLVEAVADIYIKKGLDVYVYSRNEGTDVFYEKLGFVPVDTWYEYYRGEYIFC